MYIQEAKMAKIKMSQERMGEIALMFVRNKLHQDSIQMDPSKVRRGIGNTAKELGISYDEAAIFMESLLADAFNEVLGAIIK